jgi:hypothetical protein
MRVFSKGVFSVLMSILSKYKALAMRVFTGLMW